MDRSSKSKTNKTKKSKRIPCKECDSTFLTSRTLLIHTKSKHSKRKQCTECPKNFSKYGYLRKHMLTVHNVVIEKKKPGRQSAYMAVPNDPRPYKCDQCYRDFIKSKHLTRHRRAHKEQFCDECQLSFSNISDHMLKVHGIELPRPFECDICKKTYRTKPHITSHMRVHRAENRVFTCAVCPKSFFYNTDLRKHVKSHSQNRSVICDICGATFKSSDSLR